MRKILINFCILLACVVFLCGTQISFASEISIPSLDREGAVVSFCENKNFTNADEMKNILGQALSDEANQRLSQANKTHLTHFSKFANNICSLRKIALSVQRGQITGFASEIDPNNIGDTLTGNHVTYSSSDPGDATGQVDITNPDGSTQTIYYKYTMPEDYEPTNERIYNTVTQDNVNKKLFQDILNPSSMGVIYNSSDNADIDIISDFSKNFINNQYCNGAVISNVSNLKNIDGAFIGNYGVTTKDAYGGVLYLSGTINYLKGDFIDNFIEGNLNACGGVAYIRWVSKINYISGNFIGNYALSHSRNAMGGAICNNALFWRVDENSKYYGYIVNSNFYGNYAKSESETALGGAIWTNESLNIFADNGTSVFQGNYVQSGENEKDYQAIWVERATTNLNIQQFNNGKMYMHDNINGTDGYTVNIQGDGTGTLYLYNDIKNANVTVDNTTINTANGEVHNYNFNSFHIASNFNFEPDVDLVNEKMDRITSENVTAADGAKLNVSKLHLMNDATKDVTKITFADSNLAEHVQYTGSKFISYSPIYKYETSCNIEQDENGNPLGRFTFLRSSTSNSESFNPSVLATPVATTAGVYATQLHTFGESFQHSDNYMAMTNSDRTVYKNSNRFAQEGISDVRVFSPIMTSSADKGFWVKPYATFERIPLRNGPKVSNIAYGTLIGYDTALTPIKHGFDRVMTYYVGYNGSTQHYNGIDGYQNGGVIGTTISLYKGNFFNATTVSVGASVGEMTTMYGHDYFTSLLAGIGNKTGYNFEFRNGKYIIQPNLFLGYSFIKTFDYTNKAGVRIESDPMSAIQISPGIKFIANTKKGWQPYFAINMVWNIFAHNKVMANDVRLPNMSIAPYVQYGLGVQKRFKDRFTAFAQAMVHNGGRNGVALSFGLRWALGK